MSTSSSDDSKAETLKVQGALNPRAEDVDDELFRDSDFFDPRDLVQVRYEMLRRARVDGRPVSHVSVDFGLSRPSFYKAQRDFEEQGLPGLVPRKRGPRGAHKLTDEVVEFIETALADDETLSSAALAARVEERFGRHVHPRSVERALARKKGGRR